MKYSRFKDEKMEAEFMEKGYAVIPGFLKQDEIATLYKLYNDIYYHNPEIGFWNSFYNLDRTKSTEVSKAILDILLPRLAEYFMDFWIPAAAIMVKQPGAAGQSFVHRDNSILEEDKFQYRNIWCPLVDVTPENGALFVLEGSDKWFDHVLPMFAPWPHFKHGPLLTKYATMVPAKAGDLVIYKDRTLHGSGVNTTGTPRPNIHTGLLPTDAQLCFYNLTDQNEIEIYQVPGEFYLNSDFQERIKGLPVYRRIPYEYTEYSTEEIEKLLGIEPQPTHENEEPKKGILSRLKSLFS